MDEVLKVLVVEDTEDDVELMKRELTKARMRFRAIVVTEKKDFENALERFVPDVVICDHGLPRFNSIEALKLTKKYAAERGQSLPFILVTGSMSEESAIEILRSGADDFILKDRLKRLPSAIESAREKCRIENERARALAERNDVFDILRQSLNEIYIFNAETLLFEYVNDGALNNLGYNRQEIHSLTPVDIQGELTARRFRQMLAEIEAGDAQKKIFKTRHVRKNRTQYAVEVHLQHIAQGKRKSFLVIAIDITEQNKQQAHLEIQKDKLREIARMQSHEVRAPLSRIMGLVMLIRDNQGDVNEVLPHLLKAAEELDAVIKKIVTKTETVGLLDKE